MHTVNSTQLVHAPHETSAREVAERYFRWLGRAIPLVTVETAGSFVKIRLGPMAHPAIELAATTVGVWQTRYQVVGGFLVASQPEGLFTFSILDDRKPGLWSAHTWRTDERLANLAIELEGFTPRLPRLVYDLTHGLIHKLVMRWFCRHLSTVVSS